MEDDLMLLHRPEVFDFHFPGHLGQVSHGKRLKLRDVNQLARRTILRSWTCGLLAGFSLGGAPAVLDRRGIGSRGGGQLILRGSGRTVCVLGLRFGRMEWLIFLNHHAFSWPIAAGERLARSTAGV